MGDKRRMVNQFKNRLKALQNRQIVFFAISSFAILLFAVLAWFFPYTGDDWAWG